MKLKIKDILKNKYLLYFVAFIAFFVLINLITTNKFTGILLFYVTGLLAYYFTKNMTIVLGVAIVSTFFAQLLNGIFNLQEGFKEGNDHTSTTTDPSCNGNSDCEDGYICDASFCVADPDTAEDLIESATNAAVTAMKSSSGNTTSNFANIKKSGYQNKMPLNPSTLATPSKDALSKQLGKATKLESAYDNLEKVMGNNNIKSMSGDTEKLIAKQGELLKQLKDLTPELNKTIDSVSKLDINGILGSFKGISNSLNENMKNI
tara:strand:- start:1059 stop:1844 length:786 start_codon:yes stop_codon:yes gene_type:complete